MKNLLILVPTLQLGGQERIAAKTADLMSGKYNVTLAIFDSADAVYSTICNTINLNIPARSGTLNKIVNVIKRVIVVRSLRKELQTDYVYSFGTTANFVNVLSKGVGRSIIGLRGFRSVSNTEKIDSFVFYYADAIICNSEGMCNAIIQKNEAYKKKTKCLYNPVDIELIVNQSKERVLDYLFSKHTIVSHGRLDEVKNWPRLIKAFSIIRQKIDDAQLLIIGDGPQRQELENLIEQYGLQKSVTLLGFRSNPFAYIARSTIYVLSSYSEGFPNSLVEGMAFIPAVSVDCKSGPREILSNGNIEQATTGYEISDYGVLVQPALDRKKHNEIIGDDEILADAIFEVLQNPGLYDRLKKAAYCRITEFSCERYVTKLRNFL